ncbi:MAG: outer membrane beta-barrel protein [Desulfobacteraceae bacterium]|nr:outer membrane beta-barrel protein [Desulfobacteraceae bacterium]
MKKLNELLADVVFSKKLSLAMVLIGLIFAICPRVFADPPYRVVPALTLKQVYNDNIYLSAGEKTHDFITTVSPKFSIGYETERTEADFSLLVDIHRYLNEDQLNNSDQTLDGLFKHQVTPSWAINLGGGYKIDSLSESDIDDSGLVQSAGERRNWNYDIGTEIQMTDRTSLEAIFSNEFTDYDVETTPDLKSYTTSLALNRIFTERVVGFIQTSWSHIIYTGQYNPAPYEFVDQEVIYDSYALILGSKISINEKVALNANAGYRLTQFEENRQGEVTVGPLTGTYEEVTENGYQNLLANVSFVFANEKVTSKIGAGYDFLPASGQTYNTNRVSLNASVDKKLRENWQIGAGAYYFYNKSVDKQVQTESIDQITLKANSYLQYIFNKDWSLKLNYQNTVIRNLNTDTKAIQNQLMLLCLWQHNLLE